MDAVEPAALSSLAVPDLCLAVVKRMSLRRGARRSNPRESGWGIRPRRTTTELTLQLPNLEQKLEATLPPAKIHSYETYGTPSISALGRICVWTPDHSTLNELGAVSV